MKDDKLTAASAVEDMDERAHEVSDENLEDVVGGVDILDRIKPPCNDKPPIEAPIINPFG